MHAISFPQMGDYNIPVYYLLSHIVSIPVLMPSPISKETVELGVKYSPEFVCMPFKYTLGTFLDSLEKGCDVLLQLGGGCRYGYYHELQEEILHSLGYSFTYVNLITEGHTDILKIIKQFKQIDPKFSIFKGLYYLFITYKMTLYMDKIDHYIRKNIGFEKEKGSFLKTKKEMLQSFSHTKNIIQLYRNYRLYLKKFRKLPLIHSSKYHVGIIGELYTIMEPKANYDLEYMLASYGISVTRFTNATYLLFQKKKQVKKDLKKTGKYAKNRLGADALDNIGRMLSLAEKNYDGMIHIKSTFCTPEIGVMPILRKISKEKNFPILFFSFDAATSRVGLETRVEAFVDMLEMRKKSEE